MKRKFLTVLSLLLVCALVFGCVRPTVRTYRPSRKRPRRPSPTARRHGGAHDRADRHARTDAGTDCNARADARRAARQPPDRRDRDQGLQQDTPRGDHGGEQPLGCAHHAHSAGQHQQGRHRLRSAGRADHPQHVHFHGPGRCGQHHPDPQLPLLLCQHRAFL